MKSTTSKCRINGVAFGEFSANLMTPTAELKARFALVNSESGDRFGGGEAQHHFWSDATLTKLKELVESMENDLLSLVFEGDTVTTTPGGAVDPVTQEPDVPGF